MHATYPQPLELSGSLEKFYSFDNTPCIGTEFPDINLVDWLRAPNSDELIRDLAILIAQRGAVFFRAQTEMTDELHKELISRLGQLSGRPKENGLYKPPLHKVLGAADPEVIALESVQIQTNKRLANRPKWDKKQSSRKLWHTDTSFEQHPADISSLRLMEFPTTGGDTMFASAYEVYDSFSEPFQRLLESLTATFVNHGHKLIADERGATLFEGPRGSPANVGTEFKTSHPVVRTHPVTGWKAVFAAGAHCPRIDNVSEDESAFILDKVHQLIMDNHDLQVRFRWQNPADMAVWDNRCVYHAATYDTSEPRLGLRVLGMGEKPYFDPNSSSRAEALAGKKKFYGSIKNGVGHALDEKKIVSGNIKNGATEGFNEKPVNGGVKYGEI